VPGILLSIVVTTVALGAHAQSAGGAQTSSSTPLWEQALEAMDKQDYASACLKLEEVARLGPEGLDTKIRLAECYEGSGRLASAWTMYALVEPMAEKANQPDRQKTAHERAEALKPRLATLTIVVPATVRARPGLEIRCDDRVVEPAQWGVPLPVDRGRHVIVTTATVRGEQPAVIKADGATTTVTIVPPAWVKLPTEGTASGSTKRRAAPAVMLGLLGAAGIGTGIGFIALSSSKGSDANAIGSMITAQHGACVSRWGSFQPIPCANLKEKLKERDLFHDVAVGALIGGGAAAAGTVLYLLWPSPQEKTTKQSVARDLRLTPLLSRTGSAFLLTGSF
jgi:hypothetical protein